MLGDFTTNMILPVPGGVKRPLWSVMIPTYNPKEYIYETLESVLTQCPADGSMQIEIVDDCSTKVDIPKILKEIGDKRISYYRNPKNVGHSFNFTEAVRRSRGHLVHILHDDDMVKPGFYKKFAQIFEDFPEIGAAYCRQEYIDDDGKTMFFSEPDLEKTGILDNALIKLAERQRIQYCAMVVRRSAYEDVGGYLMKNIGCEDWEMWVRIASKFDIAYDPEALAKYRIHTTSMTLTDMRSGQDMRFLREAAEIFTQHLPADKRLETTKKRNIHYGKYSFENARKLFKQYDDEEGAAAQLSETIILDSNTVYSNLDFVREFKLPIKGMGISILLPVTRYDNSIAPTIRQIANLRKFPFIPIEIIVATHSDDKKSVLAVKHAAEKFRLQERITFAESSGNSYTDILNSAIRVASNEFTVICNPGVFLDLNFLKIASESMLMSNDIGAMGGIVETFSDCKLPEWFEEHKKLYGIGEVMIASGLVNDVNRGLLSSGIVMRKSAWIQIYESNPSLFFRDSKMNVEDFIFELCSVLRLNGWRVYFDNQLKAKKFLSEPELSWVALKEKIRSKGYTADNRAFLRESLRLKKSGKNNYKLSQRASSSKVHRRLRSLFGILRRYPVQNKNEVLLRGIYNRNLLIAEYLIGKIGKALNDIPKDTKRLRILKRSSPGKILHHFRQSFPEALAFPSYSFSSRANGISVILINNSEYKPDLYRTIVKLSEQNLPKNFKWEIWLNTRVIDDEMRTEIESILSRSNAIPAIEYSVFPEISTYETIDYSLRRSRFENIIVLFANDLPSEDYLRIAVKALKSEHEVGYVTGKIIPKSSVVSPKWFKTYSSHFFPASFKPDCEASVNEEVSVALNGLAFRKAAFYEMIEMEATVSKLFNSYGITFKSDGRSCDSNFKLIQVERLILHHLISVQELSWENMRHLFRRTGEVDDRNVLLPGFANGMKENGKHAKFISVFDSLGKISRYPLKKIISKGNNFKGDSDVLEIEWLKGQVGSLIAGNDGNVKNGSNKLIASPKQRSFSRKKLVERGVSVIICCYNSEVVLPKTLTFICRQKVPNNIPWEIIIVDNASTDSTVKVAESIYKDSNCRAGFRVVKEIEPGLTAARLKGLNNAAYDYIIFCDDDNHPEDDFVKNAYDIMNSDPKIGVLGGQSIPEFDSTPPDWFSTWKDSYAIGKQSESSGDITWSRGYVWGACMVVRASAMKEIISIGFRSLLTDRKGSALSAGGDTEICYALRNEGWKIHYDSRLRFRHYIKPQRLEWEYLRKLFYGFGQASSVLEEYIRKASLRHPGKLTGKIPSAPRNEIRKTIRKLRKIRYWKLLSYNRKREGDTDLPMIEYCLGRIDGLMKIAGSYNKGLRLLKRNSRKRDLIYLQQAFKGNNKYFPGYDTTKMLNGVSVIVCTYNGADRLADTIRHIALQKVDRNILWEVIVVDNASTDNSKEVVINEWKKHKCRARLKIVDQPLPGKQLALEKGYEVSSYEYWITCDDDNWLERNFVQLTYEIMSSNERIGALGGPNDPLCEVKPPEWFSYFKRDYAAGPQPDVHTGIVSEGNITWKRGYVWGAGMIVRRSAWEQLLNGGFRTSMTCRKGTELSSGGDSEACYALVLAGWEIWYDSRLKLKHCMPAGRLSWDYLVRLFRGFGKATVGLELYEKAILLARADTDDKEVLKRNWSYEFKQTISDIRKFGIGKILSLRHPQDDNTSVLMLEFHIAKLQELIKSRKEYDEKFRQLIGAPWKKEFKFLKAQHRKFLEGENDYRYGWPWSDNHNRHTGNSNLQDFYPKISVLSPSFNSEGTIEKAILSVLNQGYPNFEHIICDGGSTDNTLEILRKYPHLKWISEPDKGQSDAMNKAFDMSSGDIIVYLNVDDYFQRGAFFEAIRQFQKNPDADMIIGNLFFEFENHVFTRVPEVEYKKIMLPFKYMFPINPVSYFYGRYVQEKIGPFPLDNHFTMDYWFLLKAYQDFKIAKTDFHLGTFCMNGYNKTSNADNRKNTHERVMYHCYNYDKNLLPFYMYHYYKHFYYDIKPWNLKRISYKAGRFFRRLVSLLSLKNNKYYSGKMFELGRYRFYENRKLRAAFWTGASLVIHPPSFKSRSRWNIFLQSALGKNMYERVMTSYRFFAYPPGMSLAHKLLYYGGEHKKNGRSLKGNSLLLFAFISSPAHYLKNKSKYEIAGSQNATSLSHRSDKLFERAGYFYFNRKRFKAFSYALASLALNPGTTAQKSRRRLLFYSALGEKFATELNILRNLYLNDKQYSLPHKLNYYGNKKRNEGFRFYGNFLLAITYTISPRHFREREKSSPGKIVISSQIQDIKISPTSRVVSSVHKDSELSSNGKHKPSGFASLDTHEKYIYLRYKFENFYDYFRYRKFKASSKLLYSEAQDMFVNDRKAKVPTLIIKSFFLYPPSLVNRNKWSLLINSTASDGTVKKFRKLLKR